MSKLARFHCVLRRLYIPIYGQYLNILVAEKPWEAWPALWPEVGNGPRPLAQGHTCFDNDEGEGYLAIRRTATHGTVAHECAHVAYYLLDYVGVKFDPKNHEAYTYLQGWIVDQVEAARKEKATYHQVE